VFTLIFLFLILLTVIGCGNGGNNGNANKSKPKPLMGISEWTNTGAAISGYSIPSLAYDVEHDVLYAATFEHGVWKYDGKNWNDISGEISGYSVGTLLYEPTHEVLYAGCISDVQYDKCYGVWKYDGRSWTDISGPLNLYSIASLAYDSNHNLLYAGCTEVGDGSTDTGSRGVWKYDGTGWANTSGGVARFWISSLAYDSIHDLLYAGESRGWGAWRYNGSKWSEVGGKLSHYSIECMAYDPTNNLLYAGCTDVYSEIYAKGVWKYDGGAWIATGGAVSDCTILSVLYDPTQDLLYAGCYDSVITGSTYPRLPSTRGLWVFDGVTWTDISGGLKNYSVSSLAYDSTHSLLFAGTSEHGVWKQNTHR